MKEKTYLKMTKKSPTRGFKLFKQKYLTKQRLYAFLAKIKLVHEVVKSNITPIMNNDLLNKVRLLNEKITTDRGIFNMSYYCQGTIHTYQWYYESKFTKNPKILYVVEDDETQYIELKVNSECEEFEVRLNPLHHQRVNRNSPRIAMFGRIPKLDAIAMDAVPVKAEVVNVNFLNARLSTTMNFKVYDKIDSEFLGDCLQTVKHQMVSYIKGNNAEINKRLIEVENDGEFTTPEGNTLLHNCVCRRCGLPVFKSAVEGYTAQCVVCDEDLYSIEVDKVDPKTYETIYNNSKELMFDILSE